MDTKELARQIRISSLKMCHNAKASHIGSCLSCADILAVLYNEVLKQDDKLIVSKGHCAAAVYSALSLTGHKVTAEMLDDYCQDGAKLSGHVTYGVDGVEFSTGSLGHGLPVACGMALANRSQKVFCLMGDGETNEGSVWESARFASEYKLSNLVALIDNNELQSFSQCGDDLGAKFSSFGWRIYKLDGHNIDMLSKILNIVRDLDTDKPKCVICKTVKGKGVSFYESRLDSHYRYPNDKELKLALEGLSA